MCAVALILAAALSCPVVQDVPGILSVVVTYGHEGADGTAYQFNDFDFVLPGAYYVVAEGVPVDIQWSDGTHCGSLPELVFRDRFETGSTDKWTRAEGE